jgi:translation initiation factor 5B
LNKSSGKPKKEKKKKKAGWDDLEDQAAPVDGEDGDAAPITTQAPVEMTAEELADEEWGPTTKDKKAKKGKKGKDKKAAATEETVAEETTGMFNYTRRQE